MVRAEDVDNLVEVGAIAILVPAGLEGQAGGEVVAGVVVEAERRDVFPKKEKKRSSGAW